jgi:hypothetical protein
MNEAKFGIWGAPESPLAIQYSLVVIEEIRYEVAQGFQKMARGGIEVGGMLYGQREGRSLSILAMRPIACEHALGPSFQLSARDRTALLAQLEKDKEDPRLEGMICAGLFVSHTRSEIALSESDLALYNIYFESPWQVVLVVRPGRAGAMRAGFFVREQGGVIHSEASRLEFDFPDRLAAMMDRPRTERAPSERPEARRGSRADAAAAVAPAFIPLSAPLTAPMDLPAAAPEKVAEPHFALLDSAVPAGPRKARWPWMVAWGLVLIALAALGWRYFVLRPDVEPISLSVLEREGQLQIEWNHTARPVATAVRGSVEISDGGDTKLIALTPADLQRGNLTYQRHSGDVEISLAVEDQAGEKTQEASRFLGKAPAPEKQDTAPVKELETKRDDLGAENNRLRYQVAEQAQRIQQLERIVKIMQARQGEGQQ